MAGVQCGLGRALIAGALMMVVSCGSDEPQRSTAPPNGQFPATGAGTAGAAVVNVGGGSVPNNAAGAGAGAGAGADAGAGAAGSAAGSGGQPATAGTGGSAGTASMAGSSSGMPMVSPGEMGMSAGCGKTGAQTGAFQGQIMAADLMR